MDVGRIVSEICVIYGYTPEYVLRYLSWPQVILMHDRGIEYDFARRGIHLKNTQEVSDVPDVARIENELGFLIRR